MDDNATTNGGPRKGVSRRRFLGVTGSAAAGLVLIACGGAATAPSPTAAPAAPTTAPVPAPTTAAAPTRAAVATTAPTAAVAVAPRGTVTVVHPQNIQTLDPNIGVVEVVRSVTGHIYDQVIELTADGQLQPMLAESWRALDPTTWEFKLRRGVKFHDGTPFNAEVLKFTVERILDPKYNSLQRTYWVPVTSITTPDEFTCVIKTERPMGTMPYTMALTTPVPPSVGKDPAGFPAKPVGTGPFQFVEWKKDDWIVMEAFGDYWGGAPKVKQIIFRTIPELSTRMSALETGEIDISLEIVPEDARRLQGRGDLDIQSVETFRTSWLWMNGGRKPFDNPTVRQAVRHAVNLDEIARSVIAGVGTRARAPIAPKVFGFNGGLPPHEYNSARAKALLTEAGFPNGFDTTAAGAGERGGYTRFGDVSEVVLAQLAEVGIRAKSIVKDPATQEKDLLELNWDMTFAGSTAVTGDADNGMARLYLSTSKRTGWSNAELDGLLTVGRESTDQNERQRAYQQAQVILWREGPTLWTYHHIDTVGVRKRVKGFAARPDRQLRVRAVSVD